VARVLVVDDDTDLQSFLHDVLSADGHEVLTAGDGDVALRVVMDDRPDLVLLDIMMPGMDGIAVCRAVRSDPGNDSIPVLMLTALSDAAKRVEALRSGADDYITKPFDLAELRARIHTALRVRELVRELEYRREEAAHLVRDLIRTEEDLRARLAADVHDVLLQPLVATRLWIEEACGLPGIPDDMCQRAGRVKVGIDDALAAGREIIKGLRPLPLRSGNVAGLIKDEARSLAETGGLTAEVDGPDIVQGLSEEEATMLYRVAREAVFNVVRHARASRVTLSLEQDDAGVSLLVSDDGVGFDPERVTVLPGEGHFGLAGMREKIEAVGGSTKLVSTPGAGTSVEVWLPIRKGEAA